MKTALRSLPLSLSLLLLIATSGCQNRRNTFVVPLPTPKKAAPAQIASIENPTSDISQPPPPVTQIEPIPDSSLQIPDTGIDVDETDLSSRITDVADPTEPGAPLKTEGRAGLPPRAIFEKFWMDDSALKSDTVYFEFDRSDIRSEELVKIEEVALFLRAKTTNAVLVDGHCDERGTEEYNRALGEKRALTIRELLVELGIEPDRIYTRSFGEDVPAAFGQVESAHAKNRRGEFALLTPRE